MRRSLVAVVAMAIALPACAGDPERATTSDPQTNVAAQVSGPATGPSGTVSPSPVADAPTPTIPEPDAWIPGRADALAVRLESTWEARREAVRRWVRTGDPDAWPPPDDVELLVLYEQRIYRVLAARDRLAVAVLNRLDHPWPPRRGRTSGGRRPVRPLLAVEDAARLPDPRPRTRRPAPAVLREGRAAVRGGLGAARGRDADRDADGSDRLEQLGRRAGADAVPPVDLGGLRAGWRHPRRARRCPRRRQLPERLRPPGDDRGALFHYNPVAAYVTAVIRYAKRCRETRTCSTPTTTGRCSCAPGTGTCGSPVRGCRARPGGATLARWNVGERAPAARRHAVALAASVAPFVFVALSSRRRRGRRSP